MLQHKFLSAGLFVLLSLFISTQLFAQVDVIKERRKLMKANSKANKAIKKALKKNEFATLALKAKAIADRMDKKFLDLFPKGTTSEKSRAKAAIWEKWDSFTGKAKSMQEVAELLADAARAKHADTVVLLAQGIRCGDCHKPFRKKKKKK